MTLKLYVSHIYFVRRFVSQIMSSNNNVMDKWTTKQSSPGN